MEKFEQRTGPVFNPQPTYPEFSVPAWWRDAKLGVCFHWGIYSVPAWAELKDGRYVPAEQAFARNTYAEWIANTSRIAGSSARKFMDEQYGPGTSYEDLADLWTCPTFDADALIATCQKMGAGYVIPTTKHHDGFCLWDTDTTPFQSVRRGPGRDLIAQLHDATRKREMRFGVYFSGALDWHVSDFPAIHSAYELFTSRRQDTQFASYAARQLRELIDRFSPDIVWNDIDWPDGGKDGSADSLSCLLAEYQRAVPDGIINDRFGVPCFGHITREYQAVTEVMDTPWEATRGLGASFGFNRNEGPEDVLAPAEAVRLLTHVVARNGNLLLNIGPTAQGAVPGVYQPTIDALGQWMSVHGEAVRGTRPCTRWGSPTESYGVVQRDGVAYVYVMDPAGLCDVPFGDDVRLFTLDGRAVPHSAGRVELPVDQRELPVAVLRVESV